MNAPKMPQAATFRVTADVNQIDSFFYTYDEGVSGAPVIAGVRLGHGGEITVYTRLQAQEIADVFTGLVAQFAEHEARGDGAR